jgi:hypothetical protein
MSQPSKTSPSFTSLDSERIIDTLQKLKDRIDERFPGSGLSNVSHQLWIIAQNAKKRAESFDKPMILVRFITLLVISIVLFLPIYAWYIVKLPTKGIDIFELIQTTEAGTSEIVLMGAAVLALLTIEGRVKRGRAIAALHELRSISHIIDMHQLTKDPERLLFKGRETNSSPKQRVLNKFELGRYLDYCSELLSITGKVAALYINKFPDPVVVDAVNDIESLTTGLSQKIWQKIMILHTLFPESDGAATPPIMKMSPKSPTSETPPAVINT